MLFLWKGEHLRDTDICDMTFCRFALHLQP